ncbi:ExbD/TolR family protein [Xylanibacter muris]|uniref:Biopolymer transporter ExbD n=1 Tax=Xylanibacter muris TaxID=2736290 RepID=A0ABX2AL93_9BACT|nr:biopolymer transporter ExbD [Xylanibacter muris]NPD91969.1 biopolymer transporter ExbD [Xylanibacter muris]
MAKKKASKQNKKNTRVDFTPMVDMMMLLITFFMLCTTLSKPQAMQLVMPSNDQNMTEEDKSVTKASHTITIFLGGNDKIYHIDGLPNYEDPSCIKETTWGKDGIRKVLINHTTEEGINPVAKIMVAKQKLDEKKVSTNMSDEAYQKELSELKNGKIDGEKIPTLTIIIKPLDTASYKNMVDALDEMQICSIGKYVIDKVSPNDEKLLQQRGIK